MTDSTSILIRTAAPRTFLIGASTVIMGCAAATFNGNGELLPATLCLLFAVFIQLYHNWAHRYFDIRYKFGECIDEGYDIADEDVANTFEMLHELAKGALVMAIIVGLGLLTLTGWWTLAVGGVLVGLAWLNCNGHSPLLRTPVNNLITFLVFGPIGVIATVMVESASGNYISEGINNMSMPLSWYDLEPAVFMSIPAGLLATCYHLVHCYKRYRADVDNNKQTLTVKIGQQATIFLYRMNAVLVPLAYVAMFLCMDASPSLWLLLPGPVAAMIALLVISRRIDRAPGVYGGADMQTIWVYFALAVYTYILFLSTGSPNDSPLMFY